MSALLPMSKVFLQWLGAFFDCLPILKAYSDADRNQTPQLEV